MKCEKCSIRIKKNDFRYPKLRLCFNCASIWQNICAMVDALGNFHKFNRDITISLDGIKITKKHELIRTNNQ